MGHKNGEVGLLIEYLFCATVELLRCENILLRRHLRGFGRGVRARRALGKKITCALNQSESTSQI